MILIVQTFFLFKKYLCTVSSTYNFGSSATATCSDKITNCNEYGSNVCRDYPKWAEANCKKSCGLCSCKYNSLDWYLFCFDCFSKYLPEITIRNSDINSLYVSDAKFSVLQRLPIIWRKITKWIASNEQDTALMNHYDFLIEYSDITK